MTKRGWIVFLLGINLILLATVILSSWRLPRAYAQVAPLGESFLMVSGEISSDQDALYVIDLARRRLHVFVPNRDQNNRRIFHQGYRDLLRDFRGGKRRGK